MVLGRVDKLGCMFTGGMGLHWRGIMFLAIEIPKPPELVELFSRGTVKVVMAY